MGFFSEIHMTVLEMDQLGYSPEEIAAAVSLPVDDVIDMLDLVDCDVDEDEMVTYDDLVNEPEYE